MVDRAESSACSKLRLGWSLCHKLIHELERTSVFVLFSEVIAIAVKQARDQHKANKVGGRPLLIRGGLVVHRVRSHPDEQADEY